MQYMRDAQDVERDVGMYTKRFQLLQEFRPPIQQNRYVSHETLNHGFIKGF